MATAITFNRGSIARLTPATTRQWFRDTREAGLTLCVNPTGLKVFYLDKKVRGRHIKLKLGKSPDLTVQDARARAREAAVEFEKGRDLQAERRVSRGGSTFHDAFTMWLHSHAKKHKRTWKEDQRKCDRFLKPWKSKRLGHIAKKDVEQLHTNVGENHGHYLANRLLALLKTVFKFAVEEEAINFAGPPPTAGIKKYPEEERERFLQQDELPRFFAALKAEPPHYCDFFLVCLFTGARRGNVSSMRWLDVNLSAGLWTIPRTKSGKSQTVPLIAAVVEILERRLEVENTTGLTSEFVFPSNNAHGHLTEFRRPWARILNRAAISDLRIHDLRRSLGSWQVMTGASLAVVGKTLGHSDPKATRVYARMNHDPVRQAMSAAVERMVGTNGEE